jgi:hypothetical protein
MLNRIGFVMSVLNVRRRTIGRSMPMESITIVKEMMYIKRTIGLVVFERENE